MDEEEVEATLAELEKRGHIIKRWDSRVNDWCYAVTEAGRVAMDSDQERGDQELH
jgi:hypothetical protein